MLERLSSLEDRYEELNKLLSDPEIVTDYMQIEKYAKEQSAIREVVELARSYRKTLEDLEEISQMIKSENDSDLIAMAKTEQLDLEKKKVIAEENLKMALIPQDPNDERNVIMEIRAGTGGEEAGLFASDLYRMYSRFAQRVNWKLEVINSNTTGIGGLKEITFQVNGDMAYSQLKHESGVHRVQRVPATESSGRIHTSAVTVAVLPEAEEVDVQINPDEIQIDIYHASGHGGQNVQKVATAVRITHIPTGLVTTCQDERSQYKNKEKALSVLRSRLLASELEKQQKEITDERRSQVGSGDRSERVRTYNFPQGRVTDHRIGLTSYSLDQMLDGEISEFVEALVHDDQARKLEEIGS
ncbi:MAG: peptide chain release factor 1 [Dehalococcoidia bacterium]|jgi:peptide chain release factor 1